MANTTWDIRTTTAYALLLTLAAIVPSLNHAPLTQLITALASISIIAIAILASKNPFGAHPHLR